MEHRAGLTDLELAWVAEVSEARGVRRVAPVRGLWGAWGTLVRVELEAGPRATVVVKAARPPPRRGDEVGHDRKVRSYAVEATFLRRFAPRAPRTPQLIAARIEGERTTVVMEDLVAAGFTLPVRDDASLATLEPCIAWLADLHAAFLGAAPGELFAEGSYWHLATRPTELAVMEHDGLRAAARELDARLAGVRHRTILHGDAKEANFLARADGAVAAVDFQYAGGGCGMRDVAYLLAGRADDEAFEARGLDLYFRHLHRALGPERASAVEDEWRPLHRVAWLDFQRFLSGWAKASWMRDERTRARVTRELAALG